MSVILESTEYDGTHVVISKKTCLEEKKSRKEHPENYYYQTWEVQ